MKFAQLLASTPTTSSESAASDASDYNVRKNHFNIF